MTARASGLVAAELRSGVFPRWRDRILGLERVPARLLKEHPANWRQHPAMQQTALAGVLEEIGQAAALLVYHSEEHGGLCIIDGHLRRSMDLEASWPCLVLDVTDQEAELLLATLDPLAAMARRDEASLAALLAGLKPDHMAVRALLADLGADRAGGTPAPAGVDPAARAQEGEELARLHSRLRELCRHYGTVSGQLWGCGVHRIVCGDATDAESYRLVCDGSEVDAVVTDFPYGVGEEYAEYSDTPEALEALIPAVMPLLEGYPIIALTPGNGNQWRYPRPAWTLAWACPAGVGRSPWGFSCWQPILVYGADPYLAQSMGCRPDLLVLTEGAENSLPHPCPKPLKVWSWLIERVTTLPGQTILDPFLGSGTSIIAAEQSNRRCLGIELDPSYVALCLERWERTTGEQPHLLAG